MPVPVPGRHHEYVALVPLQRLATDDSRAGTAKNLIDHVAVVSVRFSFQPSIEQLHFTGKSGQGRPAVHGMNVAQVNAVVRIAATASQSFQCGGCFLPRIQKRRRLKWS